MVYIFNTSKKRSDLMKRIKSNKTRPELILQKALRNKKIRFSKNCSKIVGNPDIVLKKSKIAVFVDGEFWHGFEWEKKKPKIKANRSYWIPKIERTILRDIRNSRLLKRERWKVVRFWQHQITGGVEKCVQKIQGLMK